MMNFIMFYIHKRCHMCKGMVKTWKNLGRHYLNDSRVLIGEMDCEFGDNEDLCDDLEVEYYPSYKLFSNKEEVKEYIAEKTKKQLIGYVEKFIKKQKLVKDET